ncbi:hypothetical protein KY332_01500 [Candidatus Woesearchaeota archaeon]|nr:hypothetical protein [Candidatus Woesearchaeota archaeon]
MKDLIERLHADEKIDPQFAQIDPESKKVEYCFRMGVFSNEYYVHANVADGASMVLGALLDKKRYEVEVRDKSEVRIPPQEIKAKMEYLDSELNKLKEKMQFTKIDLTVLVTYYAKSSKDFEKIREFLLDIPLEDGRCPKKDATFFGYD